MNTHLPQVSTCDYTQNAQITCDCGQLSAPVTSMSKAQIKQIAGTGMNSLFIQNFRPTLQIHYHHDFSQ